MTEDEKKLFKIAKKLLKDNEALSPMLSGSLMLSHRNINKRREATDIDILVEDISNFDYGDFFERDFIYTDDDIEYDSDDLMLFLENEDGIKLDLFRTSEKPKIVNGIPCGSVETMLNAKYGYYLDSKNEKHLLDLEFLNYKFPNKNNAVKEPIGKNILEFLHKYFK